VTAWNTGLVTLLTLSLAYLAGYGLWRHQVRRQHLSIIEERLAGERRLAALAGNVNAILWEAGSDGMQATALSASVEQILGYPLSSWNDPHVWMERILEQDRPRVIAAVDEARRGGEVLVEYRIHHQDGRTVWIEDRFGLQQDSSGTPCVRGVAFDITARKNAERSLQLTQHSIDQSGEALFWVREDGRICLVNDAACRSLGYTRSELLQLSITDIDVTNTEENWPQRWNSLKHRPSAPPPFESVQRTRDGRQVPVEISVHYVAFDGEEYVCAFVRNISERKQTEAELQRYRGHLEQMVRERTAELEKVNRRLGDTVFALESVGTAIHQVDAATGQLLYVNRAAATMLGHTPEEMLKLRVTDIDSDLGNPDDYARMAGKILAKGFFRFETTQRHKDGHGVPVEMTVYSQPGSAGIPQRFIAFGVDISERLAARRALERSEEQLRLALDAGRIGTFDWNLETDQAVCSDWHNRLWGYREGEGIGCYADYVARIHPDDRPRVEAALEQSRNSGSRYGAEYRVLWADGSEHWISETGEYRYDERGQAVRMYGTVLDISERKLAESAKEQALAAAENLARLRQEFLANMSHELRTPLNGVLGFAQIGIRNHGDTERARYAFEKILQSGNHLLGVVNDILDFSKIEQGKLIVESVPVDLCQIINEAVGHVQEQAAAKNLSLRIERAAGFVQTMQSDPLRLRQIIGNLLSNAVKFTESGSVTLAVCTESSELVLDVSDTGIGMTEDHLARLFQPFEQADGSFTRRYGGSGLGLAITGRLVELLGGSIQVRSEPGKGSQFTVHLPLLAGPPDESSRYQSLSPESRTENEGVLGGLKVLVAEDNEINQLVVQEVLGSAGAKVTVVSDGTEAVQRIVDDGAGAYDLVVMDLQMPEMNGYEATERIKTLAPDLPVVALTAHTLEEERERCDAAGMAGHIAKPFLPDALIEAVRRHARSPAADSGLSNTVD
jgi:PAS domain S-box-containing protein